MRCASCGYHEALHVTVAKDLKCPVCVCGETVAAHGYITDPPSPLRAFAEADKPKMLRPCPAKDTQLRHGKFRQEEQVERRDWFGLLVPVIESDEPQEVEYEPVGPPQVAARPPYGPGEFAGAAGNKQAAKLGWLAAGLGWSVEALYWRAADGSEGCAVRLARGALRAAATWKRRPGLVGTAAGWAVDVAYAWRTDVARFPSKITHTELEGLIK